MFRVFGGALIRTWSRGILQRPVIKSKNYLPLLNNQNRQISHAITGRHPLSTQHALTTNTLLANPHIQQFANNILQTRTLTKFSWKQGKRKTVKSVIRRFYRLHWGGWIRTKAGRHKKLWKKSLQRRRRLRQHVFCNATQCTMLDKMVTKFWKRPKYYIDDPYAPYHTREEFTLASKQPRPYFPKEETN